MLNSETAQICSLCETTATLKTVSIEHAPSPCEILVCSICENAMTAPNDNADHLQCLTNTMWSEDEGVKVTAYRLLKSMPSQGFATEALEMLYIEDDLKSWADLGIIVPPVGGPTRDANGTPLSAGDTVTLIKDLVVKGAGFTAKRGTSVRGISLTDNPEHIEGRVSGQHIVIISAFVKKA